MIGVTVAAISRYVETDKGFTRWLDETMELLVPSGNWISNPTRVLVGSGVSIAAVEVNCGSVCARNLLYAAAAKRGYATQKVRLHCVRIA